MLPFFIRANEDSLSLRSIKSISQLILFIWELLASIMYTDTKHFGNNDGPLSFIYVMFKHIFFIEEEYSGSLFSSPPIIINSILVTLYFFYYLVIFRYISTKYMTKAQRIFIEIISDLFPMLMFIYTLTNASLCIIHAFNSSDPYHEYLLAFAIITFVFCLPGFFIGIGHVTFVICSDYRFTILSARNYISRILILVLLSVLKIVHQINIYRTTISSYLIPSAMIFISCYMIFLTIFRHSTAHFPRRLMHTTIAFNFFLNSIIILIFPLMSKAPLVYCQYTSIALCVLAFISSATFQYFINCRAMTLYDLEPMQIIKNYSPPRILLYLSILEHKNYQISEELISAIYKECPNANDLHLYLFNHTVRYDMEFQYNPLLLHCLMQKAHNDVLFQVSLLLVLDYASRSDLKDCSSLKKLHYIESLDYTKSCASNFWNYVLNDMAMAASTVFFKLYRNADLFERFYSSLDEIEKSNSLYKALYIEYTKLIGARYESIKDLEITIEKEGSVESSWIRPFDGVFEDNTLTLFANQFGQFKYETGQKFLSEEKVNRAIHGKEVGTKYTLLQDIFSLLSIIVPIIFISISGFVFFIYYSKMLHAKPYSFNACPTMYSSMDTFFWDIFLNSSQQTLARPVYKEPYEEFINQSFEQVMQLDLYDNKFKSGVLQISTLMTSLLDKLPNEYFEEIAKTEEFINITMTLLNLSVDSIKLGYKFLTDLNVTLDKGESLIRWVNRICVTGVCFITLFSTVNYTVLYFKYKNMFMQLLLIKKQVVNRLYKLINEPQFNSSKKIQSTDTSTISFFTEFVIVHLIIIFITLTAWYLWNYFLIIELEKISLKYRYALQAGLFPIVKVTSLYAIGTLNQNNQTASTLTEWLRFTASLASTIAGISSTIEPKNESGKLPTNFMKKTGYGDILKLSKEEYSVHFLTILASLYDLISDLLDNTQVENYNMSYMQLHALNVNSNDTNRFCLMNNKSWEWESGLTYFTLGVCIFMMIALLTVLLYLLRFFYHFRCAVIYFFRMINAVPDESPYDDGTKMTLFRRPYRTLMSRVLETMPVGIVTTNKHGIILAANDEAVKKFPEYIKKGKKLNTELLQSFTNPNGETTYYEVTTAPSNVYGISSINPRFTGKYTTIIKDITMVKNLENTVNSISRDLEKLRDEVFPTPVSNMRDSCVYLENMIVVDIAFPESVTLQEIEEFGIYAKEYAEQTTTFFTSNTFQWSFSFMFTAYESIVRERQNYQDAVEFTKQIFKKRQDVKVGIATADGGFCIINKTNFPGVLVYSTAMTTACCLTRFAKPGGVAIEWQALMMISDIDANPDSVKRENLSGKDVDFCIFDNITSFTQKTL